MSFPWSNDVTSSHQTPDYEAQCWEFFIPNFLCLHVVSRCRWWKCILKSNRFYNLFTGAWKFGMLRFIEACTASRKGFNLLTCWNFHLISTQILLLRKHLKIDPISPELLIETLQKLNRFALLVLASNVAQYFTQKQIRNLWRRRTLPNEDECRHTDNVNKQRVLFAVGPALWLVDLRSLRCENCIWMFLLQIAMIRKYMNACERLMTVLVLLCKVVHLQCSLQKQF